MWIITNGRLLQCLTGSFASAITLWPFILLRDEKMKTNAPLILHERIHLRQQTELLILFFYVWYFSEFLFWWLQLRNRNKAYRRISFEREAYLHENDVDYLKRRQAYAFIQFLSS